MKASEAKDRFNNLPKEHRVTIIASECITEINWIQREKMKATKANNKNLKRLNEKMKFLEEHLNGLK